MPETPPRLQPHNIDHFIGVLSHALYASARRGEDLRIAQIIDNLGNCYHLEDAEYVEFIKVRFAEWGLLD